MVNKNIAPSIENMIDQTNRLRRPQAGMAIDSVNTKRPEDAIYATRNTDGSFNFATSIVEVGLLDRGGESIRALVQALKDDSANPELELPRHRGSFSFALDYAMPALTLHGNFRPDTGLTNLDITRTKVQPQCYLFNSRLLLSSDEYHDAACFVYAFQKYEFEKKLRNPKRVPMPAATAVTTFANVLNLGVAQLTREARLPQLLHAYPATIVLEDGTEMLTTEVTAEPRGHSLFKDQEYSAVGAPLRESRDWINQVSISHFMETGESIINYDEARLIAGWFNQRRKQRFQKRIARQILEDAA